MYYYGGPSIVYYAPMCNGSEESLLECAYQPFNSFCYSKAGVSCRQPVEGELRVLGGVFRSAGRLEVFANNAWGTVCNDAWTHPDAQVACRQLGFSARGN